MDKQQTTEDIISMALRHSLMVCNNCSPKPEGVIDYIKSAIEAYKAEPVAHVARIKHAVEPNWEKELAELRARPGGDPYGVAIDKIYNLMTGIADDQLRSVLCMAFLKQAIEPLVKAFQSAGNVVEITAHIKKLRELISLHMRPYNLGDMGETETAINRLILYVQQYALCMPKPSGAAPQADFKCPSCSKPWDTQKYNTCECGATISKTPAPQPEEPVWVKGWLRVPEKGKHKNLNLKIKGHLAAHGEYLPTPNEFVDDCGEFFQPDEVEWLDESPQQVFTREQVLELLVKMQKMIASGKIKTMQETEEYMNTNYPVGQ